MTTVELLAVARRHAVRMAETTGEEYDAELRTLMELLLSEQVALATEQARVPGETLSAPEYDAAKRTLLDLGYTYHGGERWKPPIGKPPSWLTDNDELPPLLFVPDGPNKEAIERDMREYARRSIEHYRTRHDRVTQSDLDQCRKAIEALQRADETLQAHPPGALLFATSAKPGFTVALGSVEATADCARFTLAADPLCDVVIAGRWHVILKISHEAGVTKVQAFREEGV